MGPSKREFRKRRVYHMSWHRPFHQLHHRQRVMNFAISALSSCLWVWILPGTCAQAGGGSGLEYCCATLTPACAAAAAGRRPLPVCSVCVQRTGRPHGEVSTRVGGFTWMDLSACVPHAQAGRMNMEFSSLASGRARSCAFRSRRRVYQTSAVQPHQTFPLNALRGLDLRPPVPLERTSCGDPRP